jgi:hypothetical protein
MRGTTPELLGSHRGSVCPLSVAPCVAFGAFGVAWEAGLPYKTSSPSTQRWNGKAFSSLTARGGGLPVGVNRWRPIHPLSSAITAQHPG